MMFHSFLLSMLLVVGFSVTHPLPEVTAELATRDTIGSDDEEQCFGCGDCSIYCFIEDKITFSASSSLKDQGSNSYHPNRVNDYNLQSAWVEGAEGYGVGEWLQLDLSSTRSEAQINGFYLFNGYRKSFAHWTRNSRVKTFKLILNGEDWMILHLHNSVKFQSVKFDPIPLADFKTLRFEILDTYPGTHYDDVAISEIKLKGIHHH
ncbi:discoidin domain-containing protein [Pontibacter sp. G13]|uniref:discoidin domain-containing protein n=1 Tax=Pontibacter sp. G13 TaxID=3074898 RepID=UPI002889375F|nr:discoidin domain-containing protein [Pontibacter sp. G13]WNJ18377.1 discoidin domain-containing protein [Pontibacter sp. G13]